MNYGNKILLSVSILFLTFLSCEKNTEAKRNDLEMLPKDTGGKHIANMLGSTPSSYGYFIYTPGNYNSHTQSYPLLIFLHGSGEKGNSETHPDILNNVLQHGPPKLIEKGEWNPAYPMIVVSPQCHDSNWNVEKLHQFISYIISNYRVNEKRIYLTGLSLGGGGTFSYLAQKGTDGYVAAAVPVAGWGNPNSAEKMNHVPIWAFHGDADKTVAPSGSIQMVQALNDINPDVKARLTIYPGVGHDSWTRTYDGSGMGQESEDYDPFDTSIYDWMFQYQKEDK